MIINNGILTGLATLIRKEIKRFLRIWVQTLVPPAVTMSLYFVIFFISALAETNRLPFDLPEDESTLVAGFFTEYSSASFALFFLAEYASMILMSAMTVILFMGGWLPPFDIFPLKPHIHFLQ